MLKRDSLVNQFELLVKHEISEHNRALANTEKQINEFRRDLEPAIKEVKKIGGEFKKEIFELRKENLALEDALSESVERQKALESSVNKSIKDFSKMYVDSLEEVKSSSVKKDCFEAFTITYEKDFKSLIKSLKFELHSLMGQIMLLKKDFSEQVQNVEKSVFTKPNGVFDIKEEVCGRIDSSKIDSQGVLKELRVYKKEVFIIEKKIENLYTLVERVNRRIESNE